MPHHNYAHDHEYDEFGIHVTLEGGCFVFRDAHDNVVGYCCSSNAHKVPSIGNRLQKKMDSGEALEIVELPAAHRMAANPRARNNFFGFGAKAKEGEKLAEKAKLAASAHGYAKNYLVYGNNIHGKGEAWYLLAGLGGRDFVQAPNSLSPIRLMEVNAGLTQDSALRRLANESRSVQGDVLVIDTVYGIVSRAPSISSLRS